MKKRTAKRCVVLLVITYLAVMVAGIFIYRDFRQSRNHTKQTISEVSTSDIVDFADNSEITEELGENEKNQSNETNDQQDAYGEDNHKVGDSVNMATSEGEQVEGTQTNENESINWNETISNNATQTESENQENEEFRPLNIMFTGDVYIGNYVSSVYDAKGINGVVSESLQNEFQSADITMVNQEFPFSTRGKPMENKQYTFRVDPAKVSLLTELGVDIVSLANNHTLDYGEEAFLDTITTLNDAGITYVGAGHDLEDAKAIRYYELQGKKIAVVSASRVLPVVEWYAGHGKPGVFSTYDTTQMLEQIKCAKEQADFVIAYVHWGIEHTEIANDTQRNMGKQYIDAGADLVVGSHPHVLQGIEYYKDKAIVYSLGNFIFSQSIESTAAVKLSLHENNEYDLKIIPCKTVNGRIEEISSGHEAFYNRMTNNSFHAKLDENGYVIPLN